MIQRIVPFAKNNVAHTRIIYHFVIHGITFANIVYGRVGAHDFLVAAPTSDYIKVEDI